MKEFVIAFASASFMATFFISALGYRFGSLPPTPRPGSKSRRALAGSARDASSPRRAAAA